MLKIGIIGLGDIAQKAYLPIISAIRDIDVHLQTRDSAILRKIGEQYRFTGLHDNIESLIDADIKAAFVHAATRAHYTIVEQLLSHHIHVYVDKPVTADLASTEKLIALANAKNLILSVGFNRRFAPAYLLAKDLGEPNMILLQKNRRSMAGDVRSFVFDDFIHVIDTLLFLFPYAIAQVSISGKKKDGLLHHVTVQLTSKEGNIAIGIMNRDSGTTEEKLEVFTSTAKMTVYNVSDVVVQEGKNETKHMPNDWEPTLRKRGFEQIITDFLQAVRSGKESPASTAQTLLSHTICEEIVLKLS